MPSPWQTWLFDQVLRYANKLEDVVARANLSEPSKRNDSLAALHERV